MGGQKSRPFPNLSDLKAIRCYLGLGYKTKEVNFNYQLAESIQKATMAGNHNFPKTVTIGDNKFNFRFLQHDDRDTIFNFAQTLSEQDLLFLRRDITQMETIDEWIRDVKLEHAITILVEDDNRLVAYGTLYHDQLFWNRHIGEIRLMVSSPYRNRGLGSRLARELMGFAKEMGLDKVIIYMAVEDKGAQHMVQDLGFRAEAILQDWVKTRDNRTHDLLIMSSSLSEIQS